jgi:molecular chaperone DnaJ
MASAALGGNLEVPTIDGGRLKINYDPGTQSGKRFRLRGKGMPGLRGASRGDAYVETLVETPVNLTKRQKEILKEFSLEGNSKGPQTDSFSEKLKKFWNRN